MSASTTQPLGAIHNKTNRGRCILTKKTTTKLKVNSAGPGSQPLNKLWLLLNLKSVIYYTNPIIKLVHYSTPWRRY